MYLYLASFSTEIQCHHYRRGRQASAWPCSYNLGLGGIVQGTTPVWEALSLKSETVFKPWLWFMKLPVGCAHTGGGVSVEVGD